MRYVLDASVAARWFIGEEAHPAADAVMREVVYHPEHFAVPELFANEVVAVLYRHHPDARRVIAEDVMPILASGILRYPMTPAIAERADAFVRAGLTGYDAVYVALAQELEAVWLTFDTKAHRRVVSMPGAADTRETARLSRDLATEGFEASGE